MFRCCLVNGNSIMWVLGSFLSMDLQNIQICFCWNRVKLAMNFYTPHRIWDCLVRRGILFTAWHKTHCVDMKGVNVLLCVISMQIAFFPSRSFFCFKNNGTEHNMRLFIHSTIVCCAVLFMLHNIYSLSSLDSIRFALNNSPFIYWQWVVIRFASFNSTSRHRHTFLS